MARAVDYARQTLDNPNPIARFAHRTRYKVSLELADELLPKEGTLVDFGAGEGAFLHKLAKIRPDARLLGVEPYQTMAHPGIALVTDMREIPPATVDVVGAFEVLEHVTDDQLREFLSEARTMLKPGGKLLVTVPIMYGLALPIKQVSRALLHRRFGDTGVWEILKGTIGLPVTRAANRLSSHKGFDFRALRAEIARVFQITHERYSPFPRTPWWTNSQAVFVAE